MRDKEKKELISILMESPMYLTLSLIERQALLKRLIESYLSFHCDQDEGIEVGYEASWSVIINSP